VNFDAFMRIRSFPSRGNLAENSSLKRSSFQGAEQTKGRTMKRTRFREEQIIGILTEHEAGAKCADLCRKHGMSEGTFYAWKAKFGGMTVSDAKRLKALEDENAKLKKLLAEQMLDAAAMKELLSKKW
jgi:putative transposase